jgi:hypothetical protein
MLASPCWLVERERGKGRVKIHSPFHSCTKVPEWNTLYWVVERERGGGNGRKKVTLW